MERPWCHHIDVFQIEIREAPLRPITLYEKADSMHMGSKSSSGTRYGLATLTDYIFVKCLAEEDFQPVHRF